MREYKFKALFENQRTGIRTMFYVGIGDRIKPEWGARVTEWLPFSGLRDRDETEIYKDDIVRLSDTNPVLFRVDMILARGGYKFVFKHLDDGTIAERYFLDKCKVVGNIWDNPELLKEVE